MSKLSPCQNFKRRKIDIYWIEGYNGYLEETKKVTYVVDWGSIIIMGKQTKYEILEQITTICEQAHMIGLNDGANLSINISILCYTWYNA